MFWSIDSCLNSVSADQYRLIVSWAQVFSPLSSNVFWSYPLTSCYFLNDRRLKFNFFKNAHEISRVHEPHLISNWPRTPKFNRLLRAGKAIAFDFSHIVMRWSRSTFNFYALIRQNLTGEFLRKIYAASGNLFTHSWSWKNLCHLVMFLTVFFFWMYKMKYSRYQDSSVIHGWIIYCAFGWEMHRMSKSLEIRFRMAPLSKLSLLTCPCLRCKKVEKSQAILASLDGP